MIKYKLQRHDLYVLGAAALISRNETNERLIEMNEWRFVSERQTRGGVHKMNTSSLALC